MSKRHKIMRVVKAVILWCISILVFIPLIIIVLNSFKTQGDSVSMRLALPVEWVFTNYGDVMEQVNIFGAFMNSAIVSVFTVIIATVGAALCSYCLLYTSSLICETRR